VQRQCATGMMAVQDAAANIRSGMADVVIAGGAETMTRGPLLFEKSPFPFGGVERYMPPSHPSTPDAPNTNMLITVGENTARECGITREESDFWSYHSNLRAVAATDDGRFADEIVPVSVPQRKGDPIVIENDEGVRPGTTAESLGNLRPAFSKEGTITAGNASQISDGGAAMVVMSKAAAERLGCTPMAELVGYGMVAGPDPSLMLQPANAIRQALGKVGKQVSDVDLFEINEAFAAVGLASMADLGISDDIVNVNGGAIALGHPIGMSGARIVMTMINELRRRGGGLGAAALCGGGGQGDAALIQTL